MSNAPRPPARTRLTRLVRRGYVESIGATAVVSLVAGGIVAATGGGTGWLLAGVTWLLAASAIGASTVHVPRHPLLTDWGWRLTVLAAAFAAAKLGGRGPALLGAAALLALLGYQLWYARQHRPRGVLEVGTSLPDFMLTAPDGRAVASSDFRGAPHVLVFYRGSWCPFCVAQVKELAAQYAELERRGVRVALISPQPADDSRDLAARFGVAMDFYVDEGSAAAHALDIVQSGGVPLAFTAGTDGDTVVPTVVITDDSGQVIWVQHTDDHRIRPEPTTFLEVIDDAGVGTR